jgi:hypothetical protein|nr:MAG TPA: hypothetical protein [Caudoviricetes sp.]DAY75343.1 MAG TPA: hypothetical protein [Caudoviricetes sp.]
MADFYQQILLNSGYLPGRALVQARGSIGGHRYVFVKLQMSGKDALVFPTTGCVIKNPFKGNARAFAGTLFEYNPDGTGYILKSYAVAKATAEATDTDIYLKRDGYSLIPFVGDILMVAPTTLTGKGTAVTVTAVKAETDATAGDVWKVTLSATLGALTTSSVLVEAKEAGASKEAMVTNPNSYLPCDFDFVFDPAASDNDFDGARYLITPALALGDVFLYTDRMQPLSAALKGLNKSKVNGWFNI